MPRFRKRMGVHYRKEHGREVAYKPGSIIEATEAELRIHDELLTTWEPIEGSNSDEEPKVNPKRLKVVKIEGTSLFNVVNEDTKQPINDIPLSRKVAFALVKEKQTDDAD